MRNSRVKKERKRDKKGIIEKKIFLHTNISQQWFSMLSTPKEFVEGDKKKQLPVYYTKLSLWKF